MRTTIHESPKFEKQTVLEKSASNDGPSMGTVIDDFRPQMAAQRQLIQGVNQENERPTIQKKDIANLGVLQPYQREEIPNKETIQLKSEVIQFGLFDCFKGMFSCFSPRANEDQDRGRYEQLEAPDARGLGRDEESEMKVQAPRAQAREERVAEAAGAGGGESFDAKARERLQGRQGLGDRLSEDTCSTSAAFIYENLALSHLGQGVGIRSLVNQMERYQEVDQPVIFKVNLDGIIGHHFTILQHRGQTTIMQGYINKQTIIKNISEGTGSRSRGTSGVIGLLLEMNRLASALMGSTSVDWPVLNQLGRVKTALFGIELTKPNLIKMFSAMHGANKGKTLTWDLSTLRR